METKIKLGKRITKLRHSKNYSQEKLAEMLNISQRSLSKIETGRNFITAATLDKLLSAFNISASQLFEFEEDIQEEILLKDIETYINKIKNNRLSLLHLHKITQLLAEK